MSLFAFIVLFQNWVHHERKTKGLLNIIDVEMKAGSLTDPLLNLWGSFVVPYGLTRLSAVTQFVKVTINALTPFAVTNRPGSKLRRFSLHKQLPHQINFSTFAHFHVFKIFLYVIHTHKYRDKKLLTKSGSDKNLNIFGESVSFLQHLTIPRKKLRHFNFQPEFWTVGETFMKVSKSFCHLIPPWHNMSFDIWAGASRCIRVNPPHLECMGAVCIGKICTHGLALPGSAAQS